MIRNSLLLFILGFLWSSVQCDFYRIEEWFDADDNAYYLFSDEHITNPGVSHKQRYDFLQWASMLDAFCALEDGLLNFALSKFGLTKLTINESVLISLDSYCRDLAIPSKNVEFRSIRNFLLAPQKAQFLANLTGKQMIELTYNAIAEIKNYADNEIANQKYKMEINEYETIINQHKAFFDYLNQEIPFADLVKTIPAVFCAALARTIGNVYFKDEEALSAASRNDVLQLFDLPLIELRLLHYALISKKKYRFIAAGGLHISRLSQFFTEFGFKKGRTFGDPLNLYSIKAREPVIIDQVFKDWCITPLRPASDHYLLKLLKWRSALDKTCLHQVINPLASTAMALPNIGACFWLSKMFVDYTCKKPSLLKKFCGTGLLYAVSETYFYARAKKEVYTANNISFDVH